MSIKLIFYNIIIPKIILEEKYNGGIESFKKNIPNKTFQEDNELVSVGFMSPHDVEWYCSELNKNGLEYNNGCSSDFVVFAQFFGTQWNVDWLDYDRHHCWFKGVLPTHTNVFTPTFKQHKVFEKKTPLCVWWNNLNDAWKNILYYNYKYDNVEDKAETLHSRIPSYIEFIGDIKESDLEKMILMEEVWFFGLTNKELREINNLTPLKCFKNLKSLTLRITNLNELSGIEDLINLEFIDIGGDFSDTYRLNKLKKLKTVVLSSKNIKSIKPLYNLKLEWLNINCGNIPNRDEFIEYKKNNPKCVIYTSYEYSVDYSDIPNRVNVE